MQPEFIHRSAEIDPRHYIRDLSHERERQIRNLAAPAGLRPQEFDFGRTRTPGLGNRQVPIIIHRATGSYFILGGTCHEPGRAMRHDSTEQFQSWYKPAVRYAEEESTPRVWEDQLEEIAEWMSRVKARADEPDLWVSDGEPPRLLAEASWVPNDEPFTCDQQETLASSLDQIQAKLLEVAKEQHTLAENQQLITESIAELKADLSHLGRKTWYHKFRSMLLDALVAAAAGEAVSQVMAFAMSLVHGAIRGQVNLPPQ